MSTHRAERTVRHRIRREIEVTSSRLVTDSCSAGLWQDLHRRCKICNKLFPVGCSISLILYTEHGQSYSGGVHTECLESSRVPDNTEGHHANRTT